MFGRFNKTRALAVLFVLGGLTLIPASQLSTLTVDTSNKSMTATGPEDPFDTTGPLPKQTLLIALTAAEPFTFAQWQAIAKLGSSVGETPGVDGVLYPFGEGDGWLLPMLERFSPSGATRMRSLLQLLRSEDGRNLGMLVVLTPEAGSGSERSRLLARLQALLADPDREELKEKIRQVGFLDLRHQRYFLGIMEILVFDKPSSEPL